jgi:hypothetical protein
LRHLQPLLLQLNLALRKALRQCVPLREEEEEEEEEEERV